jgi:hypothetical protein
MEKLIIPSILSLTDASVLTEHVLKVIAPLTSGDAKLKRLYDALLPIHERLVKNLKTSLKSEFTELRASLDRTRDLASISFRDVVHALSIVPIPEMSAKAKKLYAPLEKIGPQVYRMSYTAETALLQSLFTELDKPDYQALIADLGLQQNYKILKDSQAAFENASEQKNTEKVVRTNESEAASDIVKELMPALIKLVSLVQLYSETEPETYKAPFDQIVAFVSDINSTARGIQTRKGNSSDENTPQEPTN